MKDAAKLICRWSGQRVRIGSISNSYPMVPLPFVNAAQIPEIWRRKAPPPSNGKPVRVYRGFARNVQQHAAAVIRSGEIGGILSRDPAAASDAFFNQYGRDPVINGAQQGGIVEITVPANLWDEMLRTSSISEREGYPGFSRRINTTEIRVNSPQATAAISKCPTRIVPPESRYDFRR
jgi:hypothetical protein